MNLKKLNKDVKLWCMKNDMNTSALSKEMGFSANYLPTLLAGAQRVTDRVFFHLERVTGLKRGRYEKKVKAK